MKKQYTVCFLFAPGGDRVLMVKKTHTAYKGRLNGVGGKIESAEPAIDGALREIREETGVELRSERLMFLGFTSLPDDCGEHPADNGCVLYFYAAELTSLEANHIPTANDAGEQLLWESTAMVRNAPTNSARYAGDGDVPCWVNIAASKLGFREMQIPSLHGRIPTLSYYLLRDAQGILDMVCSDREPAEFRKVLDSVRDEYLADCDEGHERLYSLLRENGCSAVPIPCTEMEV